MANPRRLPKSLTPDELRTLIAASRPEVGALVEFLSETGLRLTEACSITAAEAQSWPLPPRRWIPESFTPRGVRIRIAFTKIVGKGDKERLVIVSPDAVRAATVMLAYQPPRRSRPTMLVPWSPRGVQKVISEAGSAAGIHAWPHRLRHTFAQAHVDAGTPVDVVADMMGHASVNTTRIYEEASRTRRIQALKRRKRWARRSR